MARTVCVLLCHITFEYRVCDTIMYLNARIGANLSRIRFSGYMHGRNGTFNVHTVITG